MTTTPPSERDPLLLNPAESKQSIVSGSSSTHNGAEDAKEWNNNSYSSHEAMTVIDVEEEPRSGRYKCAAGLNNRSKNGDNFLEHSHQIPLPAPKRDEPRFPPEKLKTLGAFFLLALGLILNLVVLSWIHDRVPDRATVPPLPDVFFDLFPPRDWALSVSEIIIICSVWITLITLFAHKHRMIILRRLFLIMFLLYLMRAITMFVTQLPVASTTYYCSPKVNHTTAGVIFRRVLQLTGGFGLSIHGLHTYCGDYMFSGHTVILVLAYLVLREYTRCTLLHWASFVASSVGVFMVILSRGHYTVDVVIAYYITTRVFWIYHTLAAEASRHKISEKHFLTRVWWFPIFCYFEKNVNGTVPCTYEWPLPWVRRIFCRRVRIS